jgi:DNA adenine methylase
MDRPTVKPPFAYFGGKITLASAIASLLPEHDHYVEPFAGSLAVLMAKEPSRQETVNDLDSNIVTFWRVLRDRPEDLERATALTPHARAELVAARGMDDEPDDLERARRVWVAITQSRGLSLERTGWKYGQATGYGRSHLDTYSARIPAAAARLRGVSIENRDALHLIRDYGAHSNVCLYVDPPYLGSTRGENRSRYGVELLSSADHDAFADALNACSASVVVSGYASPLYEELFAGWHQVDMKAPTSMGGSARTEVLWSNRPIGEPDLFSELDGGAA